MPIPFMVWVATNGLPSAIKVWDVFRIAATLLVVVAVKRYCTGAKNTAERQMHSKVIMITVSSHVQMPHRHRRYMLIVRRAELPALEQ